MWHLHQPSCYSAQSFPVSLCQFIENRLQTAAAQKIQGPFELSKAGEMSVATTSNTYRYVGANKGAVFDVARKV